MHGLTPWSSLALETVHAPPGAKMATSLQSPDILEKDWGRDQGCRRLVIGAVLVITGVESGSGSPFAQGREALDQLRRALTSFCSPGTSALSDQRRPNSLRPTRSPAPSAGVGP